MYGHTTNFVIRNDFKPGDIGTIIWLHGIVYAKEQGWNHAFEAYVAGPLAEFANSKSNRQQIWIAEVNDKIVGSVAIVETSQEQAQLRWLLVAPEARGLGLGKKLVGEAVEFSRARDYSSIFLWTVSTLSAAAGIYRSSGFSKTETLTHLVWGKELTEEKYDLQLA